MGNWLDAYKPAASARLHLLLAAMMWTAVGAVLLFFGVRWLSGGETLYVWLLLVVAVLAGLLKASLVLKPAADRISKRIRIRGDRRCIGGFLSVRTWAFVVFMIVAGRTLRGGLLPRTVVGFVFVAVGTALLLASLRLWLGWHRYSADV
ncbi:MAG: hypothetical protein JSU86_04930 [Phycisphaerales bacterium]|nr:MAG: hypothetical protein JSU86_04930 [Phycisphaerales bacterium]